MMNAAAPVVWIRSDSIPTPTTGRLAIWVWLKTADPKRQPKLRLAIEGELDGQPYYRRANVGASEDGRATQPLQQEWSPFLFPVDDLPTTGLTDLQIGFDLMDEGEVWIDQVQVFDLWFDDNERETLLKSTTWPTSRCRREKWATHCTSSKAIGRGSSAATFRWRTRAWPAGPSAPRRCLRRINLLRPRDGGAGCRVCRFRSEALSLAVVQLRHDDRGVVAAEAEAVAHGDADRRSRALLGV